MDVPTWHPAGKRMSTLQSWGLYLALKPPSLGPHGYFVHTQPFCHLRIFISPSPQTPTVSSSCRALQARGKFVAPGLVPSGFQV